MSIQEDYTFGLISEGETDRAVLKNIVGGFTGNKNSIFNSLQPKEGEPGNWHKVFKYCESDEFKGALTQNDFIIIQIDTDVMLGDSVGESYQLDIKDLNVAEIVEAVKQKIIELIEISFYQKYHHQIIFAISVHEIECWLLPIYYPQDKKKASKTINCLDTLNQKLNVKEGFTIDSNAKGKTDYMKLAKPFRKKKDLLKYAEKQESFQLFINELLSKVKIN